MGGVEVDPDTEESAVTGLYAVGECSGGMHGSNRLGGNSLVGPAGLRPAGRRGRGGVRRRARRATRPSSTRPTSRRPQDSALAPFEVEGGENPYTIQQDLQQSMNDLVGIIRTAEELEQSLEEIEAFKERAEHDGRRGAPAVQPRLAPRARPAQHAAGLASASPRRRWRARSPAAATPATTSRRPTPTCGARRTSSSRLERRRHRRRPAREAAAGDAGRAQEVLRGASDVDRWATT